MNLTVHQQLVSSLRISGSTPLFPLCVYMACTGRALFAECSLRGFHPTSLRMLVKANRRATSVELNDGHVISYLYTNNLEMHAGFWLGNLVQRDHMEDPSVDGRITLRWILRMWAVRAWTGLIWLRIRTGGGQLWMWWWTFRFHKMRGISWLAENRFVSQEELCSMEWVSK